jgi:hypothetical protein
MIYPALEKTPHFVCRIRAPKPKGYVPRDYNGSTCATPAGLLHVWRREDAVGVSSLWGGRITEQGQIRKARCILAGTATTEPEDPRVFMTPQGLRMCWTQLDTTSWRHGTMMLGTLDAESLELTDAEPWGAHRQQQMEKNWTPLPDGGAIYQPLNGKIPFGTISGGTPAVAGPDGALISFWHGCQEHHTRARLYYMGALEMREGKITRISRKPLVWGSEENPALACPRSPTWFPLCIFPAGLVREDGGWLVSCGVNDSYDAWLRFRDDELDLVPVSGLPKHGRAVVSPGDAVPEGSVMVRVISNLYEPGGPYRKGEHFLTTPRRAGALGPLVEIVE